MDGIGFSNRTDRSPLQCAERLVHLLDLCRSVSLHPLVVGDEEGLLVLEPLKEDASLLLGLQDLRLHDFLGIGEVRVIRRAGLRVERLSSVHGVVSSRPRIPSDAGHREFAPLGRARGRAKTCGLECRSIAVDLPQVPFRVPAEEVEHLVEVKAVLSLR